MIKIMSAIGGCASGAKKTFLLLALASILVITAGCGNSDDVIVTRADTKTINASVQNTNLTTAAEPGVTQMTKSDLDGIEVAMTLPENLYLCRMIDSGSGYIPTYAMRFNENCAVIDVWEVSLDFELNTEQELIIEDVFNKYSQNYGIQDVRQVTTNKEYTKINGQDALKVYLPQQDEMAIVIMSKEKVRAAIWKIYNAKGELNMMQKYDPVINSFEFKNKNL